jgi:hypothetical protein
LFRINLHVDHNDENASAEDIDKVEEMLNTLAWGHFQMLIELESSTTPSPTTNDYKSRNFDQLLEDARRELYPGCKTFQYSVSL